MKATRVTPQGQRSSRVRRRLRAAAVALVLVLAVALVLAARGDFTVLLAARSARRALAAGHVAEAATPVDRWLRARPDSAEAHFLKARVAYAQGRLDEAAFHLDRAHWLGHSERPVERLRALLRVRLRKFAEAEPVLARLLSESAEPD